MTPDQPFGLRPKNTTQGRPRTAGDITCARCGRSAGKHRASWPEGKICGTCFTQATRTNGSCPGCSQTRLLPGAPGAPGGPSCSDCAGIGIDFRCQHCNVEGEFYRSRTCARCALRQDLTTLLHPDPGRAEVVMLLNALCAAARPESIHTWKRSPRVQTLLSALGGGSVPLTHTGLDNAAEHVGIRTVDHLRAILISCGALPPADRYLARFEQWITTKLAELPEQTAQPVRQFATRHHLHRIRNLPGHTSLNAAVHSAKQEITETIKFLTWLDQTHQRTATTCTQLDVDAWLAAGPTTRTAIRTFFVFARKNQLNTAVIIKPRLARTSPDLTQEQRLSWIRELLIGTNESLPSRVAGTLLLLMAQPIVRIAALRTDDLIRTPGVLTITLGKSPAPVPQPFADLINSHTQNRPNLRTAGGPTSPWIFPGTVAGQHLHPNTIMSRLRALGINLQGARNRALTDLVTEIPPPLVAETLGYSHQVTYKYAEHAAEPWVRYAGHSGSWRND